MGRGGPHGKHRVAVLTEDQRLHLSGRELETLAWKAAHYSESAIARKMHVKTSTVHTHMKHVREKLQVRSADAAVRSAQRRGLLPRA